tara:strand:- start:1 stop:195 length:195 start_codon:yes stop_codon:yes gene_type:complete
MNAKGKNARVESSFNECFKAPKSEGKNSAGKKAEGKKAEGKKAGSKKPYPGYNPQKGVGKMYKP